MKHASIGPIVSYLPEKVETNDQLAQEFPSWDLDLIYSKTGIRQRHIAAPEECASDLGVRAAERLFEKYDIDPQSIDFLLFCTQTPDYPLPTTACLLQQRLNIPQHAGALDFNLGCSGFVYGLALADGLIRGGTVQRVLLITGETYSRYIDTADRSLRTIFGDGAAATLIEARDEPTLNAFQYGTDGSGADTLLVTEGGARLPQDAHTPRHRKRWKSKLYMDGPSLMNFTVGAIPQLVDKILEQAALQKQEVNYFLMHQATRKMLQQLQESLGVPEAAVPLELEDCGNTVSSTIPILIERMRADGRLQAGNLSMLIGFGVGWSWSGCIWRESFRG